MSVSDIKALFYVKMASRAKNAPKNDGWDFDENIIERNVHTQKNGKKLCYMQE